MTGDQAGDIILCFGTPGECQCCGGSTTSVDAETGERGPFEGDSRFCSEDCFAEVQEMAEHQRQMIAAATCSTCGFDNFEHADDCTREGGTNATGPALSHHGGSRDGS